MEQTSIAQFFATPRASSLSAATMKQIEKYSKSTPQRKPRKRPLKSQENGGGSNGKLQQMIIDIGQKNIGMGHCMKCGMVYSQENPQDQKEHERYHNRFVEIRNFRVTVSQIDEWKKVLQHEEVSAPVSGTLFKFNSTTTATLRRKIEKILSDHTNEELGYANHLPTWNKNGQRQAIIFIADPIDANPYMIAGLLLTDAVNEVYVMPQQKCFHGPFLGVDRVWVHAYVRRKGIATFLLDSARRLLAPAGQEPIKKTRVAFSDPSELGVLLALRYMDQHEKVNGHYITYSSAACVEKENAADTLVKKMSSENASVSSST